MSIMRSLEAEAYDRSYGDIELLRRLATYFAQYRSELFWTVALMTLISFAGAGVPLAVSEAVDRLTGQPSITVIVVIGGIMVIFGVIVWLGNWVRRRIQVRVVADVVAALRRDAFNATVRHDMGFFDQHESGHVISRITSDTEEFAQVVQLVTEVFTHLLMVFVLLFVLVGVSGQLTLMLLVVFPLVLGFTAAYRKLARYVTRRRRSLHRQPGRQAAGRHAPGPAHRVLDPQSGPLSSQVAVPHEAVADQTGDRLHR